MDYDWIRATVDRVICTAPTWISTIIITPSSASKKADITLYDGESTSDPQILKVMGGAGENKVIRFDPPLKTKRGLYLDVGGDCQEVVIQFYWEYE